MTPYERDILEEHYPEAVGHEVVSDSGVLRYKQKPLMRWLADAVCLNEMCIAYARGKFSLEEYMQFYRDMGYSCSGFMDIFAGKIEEDEQRRKEAELAEEGRP